MSGIPISKEMNAISAVQEGERRYQRPLSAVMDCVYCVNMDRGRTERTSYRPACEAVTGYTSGELESDPLLWLRVIHSEDQPVNSARFARLVEGDATSPLEYRIIHKNGCIRWIKNTPGPHMGEAGTVMAGDGFFPISRSAGILAHSPVHLRRLIFNLNVI